MSFHQIKLLGAETNPQSNVWSHTCDDLHYLVVVQSTMHILLRYIALGLASILYVGAQRSAPRVLIYSATAAYRHDSIPTAIRVLKENGASINTTFDATEDRTFFTDSNLKSYDAIVFLSNTGEVLDDYGKAALENYFNSGGNFVGIHSASDSLRNTTFFVRQLGAKFDYHPELQEATVDVIAPSHPSTNKLPQAWKVRDEMYNFESDPRSLGAVVVLAADESSYTDTRERKFDQGTPHPLAWYQEHAAGVDARSGTAGRSFYTSLGHLNETWEDSVFLGHVLGGIGWVLQSNTTRAFNSSGLVGNAGSSSANGGESGTTPGSSSNPSKDGNGAEGVNVSLLILCSTIFLCLI